MSKLRQIWFTSTDKKIKHLPDFRIDKFTKSWYTERDTWTHTCKQKCKYTTRSKLRRLSRVHGVERDGKMWLKCVREIYRNSFVSLPSRQWCRDCYVAVNYLLDAQFQKYLDILTGACTLGDCFLTTSHTNSVKYLYCYP